MKTCHIQTVSTSRTGTGWSGYFRLFLTILVLSGEVGATPDLWIRDDAFDIGDEPNTLSPTLYRSDDIWIRRLADPNYDPEPFLCTAPTWTPLPHQGPCYRDPIYSSPNFMYVRVRNRGASASLGTETLHVYWAKASTGLSWPLDWNDHLDNPCGGALRLYGYEVTKPRKNGATASATEVSDYVAAIQMIDTASFLFPGGDTYFDKQNLLHQYVFTSPNNIHGTLQFFPWHREMMSRYEVLLRKAKPALTLLYWDWNTDPSPAILNNASPAPPPPGYMGLANGAVGAPFPLFGLSRNKAAGAPSAPGLMPGYESGTSLPSSDFDQLWGNVEAPSHNQAHGYFSGTVSSPGTAAQDPLFFMLHANADRVWAKWQRLDSANVDRWTPGQAYDTSGTAAVLNAPFKPFDGSGGIQPWTPVGGHIIAKTSKHHSIVYPPVYDDVLLKIPVLDPGECTIIEIPFYPPPQAECGSFADPSHLCLLARIEPITSSPPEGAGLWQNVKNHNNIAWKNVTLSDCSPGPFFIMAARLGAAGQIIRNPRLERTTVALKFNETIVGFRSLFDFGHLRLRLDPDLFDAWELGGRRGEGIEVVGINEVRIVAPGATMEGIAMEGRKVAHMDVALELDRDYPDPAGEVFQLEILQGDDFGGIDPVGGQTIALDFNLLPLVEKGSDWKFLDGVAEAPTDWQQADYDDSGWPTRKGPFGSGRTDVATGLVGDKGVLSATYFRREFEIESPEFYRNLALNLIIDDGVAVYLNGTEIHRQNLPDGPLMAQTPALEPMELAAARACRSVRVDNSLVLLREGLNVIAVEVHPAAGAGHDIAFDLELAGNVPSAPYQAPAVVIVTPPNGAIVRVNADVEILADVMDPDGDLDEVKITFDGVNVFSGNGGPFQAIIQAPELGSHRVSVEARDQFGHVTRMESVFTVVRNLNPTVTITSPLMGSFPFGAVVPFEATATDADGTVVEVAFHFRNHFGPDIPVGVSSAAPFRVDATGVAPGHYAAYATATDDQGGRGYSLAGHFVVAPWEIKDIVRGGDGSVVLTWDSRPGLTYFVEYSEDLVSWFVIKSAHPSQGDETQFTYTAALGGPDPSVVPELFLRVGEN